MNRASFAPERYTPCIRCDFSVSIFLQLCFWSHLVSISFLTKDGGYWLVSTFQRKVIALRICFFCYREVDNSPPPVVILDDNEMEQHVEAEEMKKQGEESVEANEAEEKDKDAEVLEELPDWLPDGWIMEVRCGDNGNIYRVFTLTYAHTYISLCDI